jgi:hypothetical protein
MRKFLFILTLAALVFGGSACDPLGLDHHPDSSISVVITKDGAVEAQQFEVALAKDAEKWKLGISIANLDNDSHAISLGIEETEQAQLSGNTLASPVAEAAKHNSAKYGEWRQIMTVSLDVGTYRVLLDGEPTDAVIVVSRQGS